MWGVRERKESGMTPRFLAWAVSCKEIVVILSCLTLLLFFSCPNFSVSIYSRLSTLFLQPQPKEQSSVLYFSTFLQIGCACCHCRWPYSPILPSPETFRLLCTVSSATGAAVGREVDLQGMLQHVCWWQVCLCFLAWTIYSLNDSLWVNICVTRITQILKLRETLEKTEGSIWEASIDLD